MTGLVTLVVRLWRIIVGGLMLAVVVLTVSQVFARYVLNSSIIWAEEANRLLYVWVILLAAAGADHMRIGLIADKPRLRPALARLGVIAGVAALGLVVWGGWTMHAVFGSDRYLTLGISKSWYFWAAILGGSFWAVVLVWRSLTPPREEPGV
ncbi:TRAP transporter small permease subunit [Roseobacter sp. YSTF-M11]|uniref:TRAP transporter small permease protein n=1 Tax=Roseobacter insulae TaxID=2859783 RepID=A0A9X1FYL3_9RHOB|nr:TRAP transporter small permease subunit [Roseobacter insulae]MBW4709744.1 TRAP transporter small permease subunit [Roseobacter insulae]